MKKHPIVGRFAPTPSGRMHLGNILTALLAWLSVRSRGGKMILRIEDLDPARTSSDNTLQLIDDLLWLGLDWDEGSQAGGIHSPYRQSERTGFYKKQLQKLREAHLLYPCFCSRVELHAAEAPHSTDGNYIYSGHCKHLSKDGIAAKKICRVPAFRVIAPNKVISFTDGCQSYQQQNLATECGDFIVQRSDGVFAYQLAVAADDGDMGITEVVRGSDLLASTPRQIWLMETLGYKAPQYYHVPLLLNEQGRRLSKRDKDTDLSYYRKRLTTPKPLLGALAHMAGLLDAYSPLSAADLIPVFRWERVKKNNIMVPQNFINVFENNTH